MLWTVTKFLFKFLLILKDLEKNPPPEAQSYNIRLSDMVQLVRLTQERKKCEEVDFLIKLGRD